MLAGSVTIVKVPVKLRATNYYKQPLQAEIQLDGAGNVDASRQHIVIRSDNPSAENTLENPRRIQPREQPLSNCAQRFTVTLPPSSVNVLRIPAEPLQAGTSRP